MAKGPGAWIVDSRLKHLVLWPMLSATLLGSMTLGKGLSLSLPQFPRPYNVEMIGSLCWLNKLIVMLRTVPAPK